MLVVLATVASRRSFGIVIIVSTVSVELPEADFRLHGALAALELERPRDDRHRQRAQLVGQAGDDGRRAGARAAAEAGGDEDQVGAGQHFENLFGVFERGRAADVGIRAGAESLRQLPADLNLRRRRAARQRLLIRVGDDELDVAEAGASPCG